MAIKTVTQIPKEARMLITDMDALTHGATEAIQAMAKGAQQLLIDGDNHSVMAAYNLLQEIWLKAETLNLDISTEAESVGANWKEYDMDAAQAIYAKYPSKYQRQPNNQHTD